LYAYCGGDPINCIDPNGLEGYMDRALGNFSSANTEIFGALAPTGLGLLLGAGGVVGEATGTVSFLPWAASGFSGVTIAGTSYSAFQTAAIVLANAIVTFSFVGSVWEGDLAVGSLVSAICIEGAGTVGEFWGGTLFSGAQRLGFFQ
jgi:hypothetical protein